MKKILIIEDELNLQKILSQAFKKNGYEIFTASDGLTGLKIAENENPNLIILDLILPKMSGFDVLKNLKTEEKTKNIPVVIITNLSETQDIHKALELGAKTYLIKANYTLEDLINKIKGFL